MRKRSSSIAYANDQRRVESSSSPISEVSGLVLVLVVVLSLPNEALAKLGARPVGLLRHNESRFSCDNFVRSVSRWDIQLLEDEHEQEHEHGFSISEF
jgi:hypothetical protein